MKNQIKVGDKVEVLDEDFFGVVVKISGTTFFVKTNDGFELEYSEDQIIRSEIETDLLQNFSENLVQDKVNEDLKLKKKQSKVKVKKKERYQPTMEVDLHSHKLLKSTKGMSKHDILIYQLDTARHKLEFAIDKKIQRLVFIHGVGEGVLKLELEYLFGRYDKVKFYDADYQKYGVGATEVYVSQNAKRI